MKVDASLSASGTSPSPFLTLESRMEQFRITFRQSPTNFLQALVWCLSFGLIVVLKTRANQW
ncbi:hypothetical protein BCR33DRAFT_729295 [Rhizoclosmatium globosum]|uniref:Uncharacterized protein n=1 Tax=Rhizoclosmatium globosum TaxID=329046 RepID=A0A1Y2AGK4_9FUNG|nr:hypothetical protein BCR33DRAFT_729295 [Rhizoclosmatium globosum]|eukprot:ORY21636.1 hypothetical protein BCR33DRAFT_729295 [Rhizoclosmatium globosum]